MLCCFNIKFLVLPLVVFFLSLVVLLLFYVLPISFVLFIFVLMLMMLILMFVLDRFDCLWCLGLLFFGCFLFIVFFIVIIFYLNFFFFDWCLYLTLFCCLFYFLYLFNFLSLFNFFYLFGRPFWLLARSLFFQLYFLNSLRLWFFFSTVSFDQFHKFLDIVFFTAASSADRQIFLYSSIEFAVKLLTKWVISLANNGKKVVKLALVYLRKDFITFWKKFERQIIEVQV